MEKSLILKYPVIAAIPPNTGVFFATKGTNSTKILKHPVSEGAFLAVFFAVRVSETG